MSATESKTADPTSEIKVIPPSPYTEVRKISGNKEKLLEDIEPVVEKEKSKGKAKSSFFYDPQKKTVLGRSSINWARLALFYTVFYFCLGCFFVILLYGFALMLDRSEPRYYNKESTMAVRTTATVVGMGFRPQPDVTDSLITVSHDPTEQKRIASSLRLFRDVFLVQKPDAKVEDCTPSEPASELSAGTACAFGWHSIVRSQDHPCSDNNFYGYDKQEPCILVKVNKIYGWAPTKGNMPPYIQRLQGSLTNKTVSKPDVYVTCAGSYPADRDVNYDITYYSLGTLNGSNKYGSIPFHYFPYKNAPDHVQPFVLVQFKNLPKNRLVSITCRLWAPNVQHDSKNMRGMVSFQLFRSVPDSDVNDDRKA